MNLYRRSVLFLIGALFCSLSVAGTTAYDYDELGRLKTAVHPNGVRMDYGLDKAGNRTVVTSRPAEGVLGFAVSSTAISEAGGTVDITVSRTNGVAGTVGATLQIGGTASGGTDYFIVQPEGATITLAPGVTSATIRISIVDDTAYEIPDEAVVLTLTAPSGGALLGARTRHTLTIGNNDQPPHPDQTPPTAPGNVAAMARATKRVEVIWTSATDTGGSELVLYIVERCTGATCTDFEAVGAQPLNGGEFPSDSYSYIDTTVQGSTTYLYRVRARDGAGNEGPHGGPDDVTTPDLLGPTAPRELQASSPDRASVNLMWQASEDDGGSGLASYRIERCSGFNCTNFAEIAPAAGSATTYNDTAVSASQVYRYRVRARDGAGNDSSYSNIAGIAPADLEGPLAPPNVAAAPESSALVHIAWSEPFDPGGSGVARYFVERCEGAGCTTNFVEIGSPTWTSHLDGGVSGATTYGYRVRARDGAGNDGTYSDIVRTTTPARTPPTTPTNLTAVGVNPTTIQLNWTGSEATDGSIISLYIIERCTGATCTDFEAIGNQPPNGGEFPSSTYSYRDSPLAAYTTYRYRVAARDSTGTYSAYTNIDDGTTPDLNPPGAPGTLSASASGGSISLSWGAASDTGGSGLARYRIERCTGAGCSNFTELTTTPDTTFTDTSVGSSTTYQYRVRALDGAGNPGPFTNTVSATTVDFQGPTAPDNLVASAPNSRTVNLSWAASSDPGNSGVQAYFIERCAGSGCTSFSEIGTSTGASYVDYVVDGSTTYNYRVRARDGVGNYGGYSSAVSVTTPARTPPTTPTNLSALGRNTTRVEVIWTASTATDGSEIVLYEVERCTGAGCSNFEAIGFDPPNGGEFPSQTHSYEDRTVSGWTTYRYRVRARDTRDLHSEYSNIGTTTTPDLAAPTAPGNLQITSPNSNTMNLGWVASTEYGGSGLVGYHIERCTGSSCTNFGEIGQSSANAYTDSTVSGMTSYRYRVRARDNAGNYSSYSNIQSLETSDTIAPQAPTNVTASSPNSSVVNLSWTAPPDGGNSGLSHYLLERCAGNGCTNFGSIGSSTFTSVDDIGVSAGVTYRYRVRAVDRAGNVGPYSAIATVTTPFGTPQVPSISVHPSQVTTSQSYTVSWTPRSDATHYELHQAFNNSGYSLFYSGPDTSRLINSIAGSFSYRVKACNGSMCSVFSGEAGVEVCGAGGCN